MKKLLFCVLWMVGTVAFTSAQKIETVETTDTVFQPMAMCDHIPLSHLSFAIKPGVTYPMMSPVSTTVYDNISMTIGGTVDYTVNPIVGIGVEYNYNDYSHPYTYMGTAGDLVCGTHDAMLYGSVNFSNAFSPYRTGFWKNLNIYGDFGRGIAFYHFSLENGDIVSNSTTSPPVWLGKLGLNAEFTLTKSFNLSFEGQYRIYDTRKMASSTNSRSCDAMIFIVGLRYKFASGTLKHARNISLCEYSPRPVPVIINKTFVKGDTDETLNRLKAIEKENADLKQKMQKQQNDAKVLVTNKEGIVNISIESIDFVTGSSELSLVSTQILDQAAGILKNNPSWSEFKIYGHTDYVGTTEYNQELSESRALAVKNYFLSKGVPGLKVITTGLGENKPIDTNDTPIGRQNNRRVEFEITK